MKHRSRLLVLLFLPAASAAAASRGVPVTRTGWLADEKCATSRTADGRTGSPGRAYAQECIRKGVPVVFMDEKTKALFRIRNPAASKGRECDHVEITGMLDEKERTLRLATIKVLEPYVARCDAK